MKTNTAYLEKIYAGLLGMDAGMRLGAPVESPYWTYRQLQEQYGDMHGYLRVHKNHPPDDDVNGPILLVRALTDRLPYGETQLTPEMAGEAWLNYTRCGKGMFWWGGEDVSTEHRAYMNLRRGVKPPASGSAELNGKTASEQIGGQIFVDTWGLLFPGNPQKAAEYAAAAASVSHDGNGVYGGRFMAACVAAAFTKQTIDEILDAGLAVIPDDCDYAKVVQAVRQFHAVHPRQEEFRACRDYVERAWGHDKFPGGWHIIPNAGICVTALLYGQGDLGRSLEISVMCGFDTDCNASNIGTILGVFGGLDGVPERYRAPINDTVLVSGCSGYLNIVDLPSFARELWDAACLLNGFEQEGAAGPGRGDLQFDFALPGSVHGLQLSDRACYSMRNREGNAYTGNRFLELMIDGKQPEAADLFFNGCITTGDLTEDRYDPAFSPRVYPGQTVTCRMKAVFPAPAALVVQPFVTKAMTGERIGFAPVVFAGSLADAKTLPGWDREFDLHTVPDATPQEGPETVVCAETILPSAAAEPSGTAEGADGKARILPGNTWVDICFTVPELAGDQVHTLGWNFSVRPTADEWAFDFVYIDEITVTGPMAYDVEFAVQREEFGQVTPFTFSDCTGSLTGDALALRMPEEPTARGCQAFTGNYYMHDTSVQAQAAVQEGDSALLLLRGQGVRRYYAFGLVKKGKCAILRYESGSCTEIAACTFPWEQGKPYMLSAAARGSRLTLAVDGQLLLQAEDDHLPYGMVGLGACASGSVLWRKLRIEGSTTSFSGVL